MAGQRKLADEVRTGLVLDAPQNGDDVAELDTSFLDAVWERKPVRDHVYEFGCLFGAIGCCIAGYRMWHGQPTMAVVPLVTGSLGLVAIGRFFPAVLWPLWKAWMGLAKVLNMIVTPCVLALLWTIVLTPTALVLRLIGKSVMDLSFGENVETYWIDRPESKHSFKRLERMF